MNITHDEGKNVHDKDAVRILASYKEVVFFEGHKIWTIAQI